MARGLLTGALIALGLSAASPAWPCATCACGDPTLTLMGTGRAFDGRLRLSLEAQGRAEEIGERGDLQSERVVESRLTAAAAYTPTRALQLALRVPTVRRVYTAPNLARDTATHLGDVEARGRVRLYEDRPFGPRHLAGLSLGLRAPTAPRLSHGGAPLPEDVQPGVGAWVPLAGAWYAWRGRPWSIWTSAGVERAFEGWAARRPGLTILATAQVQYQPGTALAVQVGLDGRWAGRDEVAGAPDPTTGGELAMISVGLVGQPHTDWLLHATLRAPVVDRQAGERREGLMWLTGLTVDL